MLNNLDFVASLVILILSMWAVLTERVPNRTGGAVILCMIALAALANMAGKHPCVSPAQVWLTVFMAIGGSWACYHIQFRRSKR